MKIPFIDLKRQHDPIKDELEKALLSSMNSMQFIEGPNVKDLEKKCQTYLDVEHAITCGNGTDSLRLALQAAGVSYGDEVITTAFSFFATAETIASIGAVPIFIDIFKDDYNIDYTKIEEKITSKTKAILPVHIFGYPADMDEICAIGKKHGICVIEDACQAIGAKYKGKMVGGIGELTCFSFYPTKNLGAYGDGGMVTTNSDGLSTIVRAFKTHAGGKDGYEAARILNNIEEETKDRTVDNVFYDANKYYNYLIGSNSRLDDMQAAILNVKLAYLDKCNEERNQIAKYYYDNLSDVPFVMPNYDFDNNQSAWHQFVGLTDKKNELIDFLASKEIGAGSFYPVPLHLQKAFSYLNYKEGDLPVAEEVCASSVCLPIYPGLTEEELAYIVSTIKEFYNL